MKKTKVVCTIGPASEQKDCLEKLIGTARMNVMRMNFSHGDYDEQGFRIKNVKALNAEKGWFTGMALDTKGPEIRTGELNMSDAEGYKGVQINAGDKVVITMDYSYKGGKQEDGSVKVSISYEGLYDDVQIGNKILFEDGLLQLVVKGKDEANRELICEALNSRKLKNKRNCNVPGVILNMPYISPKDKADMEFACDQDLDFIFASFVRRADDIKQIRDILARKENTHIKVISKIENQEGVKNMEEIIKLSDGVMVARGDLGVDVDAWDLPEIQKDMIFLAQSQGKIVITATQMLDSMQQNPRPTRAEVSDVHNAVLDGTSATMLSGESAQGDYPFLAVDYMSKIDEKAEESIDHEQMINNVVYNKDEMNETDALGLAVATIAMSF
ncbi:MAG: pyruvate kinase, partial [Acholeplasmatales bacterium]|nr:pyruvate kinase [Acholeplasmatales bacterium]